METQTLITINNFNCLLHCYCGKTGLSRFPSFTTTKFLLLFLLHHHPRHISIVFTLLLFSYQIGYLCLTFLAKQKQKTCGEGGVVEEENNGNVMVVAMVGEEGKQ